MVIPNSSFLIPNYAVAMSGGVDSSVAAALMKKDGHNVLGFTMKHFDDKSPYREDVIEKSISDAKKVCQKLDIPHHVIDVRAEFHEIVVKNFIKEYSRGITPNPCALCNPTIKWGLFVEKIKELLQTENILYVTGHYARLVTSETGNKQLHRAADIHKDQTYMLWRLSQEQLNMTHFPLSETTKEETRSIAEKLGLSVKDKADSQDICFLEGKYTDFLSEFIISEPGDIIFEDQKIIGQHKGLSNYTLGQRKGLVSWQSPLFVKEMNPHNNSLIVTDDPHKLLAKEFYIGDMNILDHEAFTSNSKVQMRYNSTPKDIHKIELDDDKALIVLETPARSITPGQSAVFYDGDRLVAGGVIVN
jgi:tRNA-specific 2-thiouridylase